MKDKQLLFKQIDRITKDDPTRLIILQPNKPIGFYKPQGLTTIIGTKNLIHFREQSVKKP